jgi:NAD(P)-dependent dehydrogenase (short-subunit alcohol dehydrogenase family)
VALNLLSRKEELHQMAGTVLVVGAAGGVGSQVVELLLARGEKVIGTVLNTAEAEFLRQGNPGINSVLEMDCSDADNVRHILDAELARSEDQLAAVVVCAAISPYGPVETEPLAMARRTLEINVISGIALYQAAMPYLRKTAGRIIYISSMAGRFGMPFIGFYTSSKFALEGAVEVMRCEASRWGVELVLIEPGSIQTAMMTDQVDQLNIEIAQLETGKQQLYGSLYRQFLALSSNSYDGASKPEAVAEVVLKALDARRPKVRYRVGKDSRALVFLAWLLPRRWFEALALKAFSSAAGKG